MSTRRYIVFEGVDHCGKTTQLDRAERWLHARGHAIERLREPGGTPTGERIRSILLDPVLEISARTELLLFMASRVQLLEERVKPALRSGKIVLQDRYWYSTAAYQGGAGKLGFEEVHDQVDALKLISPGLVIYLDGDPRALAARHSDKSDRFEAKGIEYQEKVRAEYLRMAKQEFLPGFFWIVNAERGVDEVHAEIAGILEKEGF
jgi:dTMP kinase